MENSGEWTKRLRTAEEIKAGRVQNEGEAPPVTQTEIIKVGSTFEVWPKDLPQQEIVYQWKCAQPNDDKQKMKLVQAAYACAVHFMPQCTHVLIRSGIHKGTDFDEDGFANAFDRHHITVSYRDDGLTQKLFETAHCYTESEKCLKVIDFKSAKVMKGLI